MGVGGACVQRHAPYGATKRVRGVPTCGWGAHVGTGTVAFGGATHFGHEACEGCADMGGGDPCGHRHWGFWWSSLYGPRSV
eukprot:9498630-Pyramimonas_sp.AAC.1